MNRGCFEVERLRQDGKNNKLINYITIIMSIYLDMIVIIYNAMACSDFLMGEIFIFDLSLYLNFFFYNK